jgi:hypothetical protein
VNAANIEALQHEVERLRERCHQLESDRATVRVLQKAVTELTDQLPNLARRAAREAVAEAHKARHRDTLANLRTYAALLGAGVGIGALIVQLIHG